MENETFGNINDEDSSMFDNVDFHRLLYIAKKELKYIVAIFVLAAIACFLFIRYSTPKFKASTILQISAINRARNILESNDYSDNQGQNQDIYGNSSLSEEIELLKSKFLLKKTLTKLPLQVSYYNKGHFLSHELYKNAPFHVLFQLKDSTYLDQTFTLHFNSRNKVTISMNGANHQFQKRFPIDAINLPGIFIKIKIKDYSTIQKRQNNVNSALGAYSFVINSVEGLADKYIKNINVNLINPNAKTVKISVTDPNAKKAAEITKALANEFIQYDVEKRSESAERILEFIDQQLSLAYNRMKSSEQKMQDYKKMHQLSDMNNFSSIYLNSITNLSGQIVNLSLQINVLKEVEKKIKTEGKNLDAAKLLSFVSGTDYADNLSDLIRSLYGLYGKRENIKFTSTSNNLALKNINNQIKIQKDILIESLENEIKQLNLSKNKLNQKNNEIVGKFSGLPSKQIEYARLQRIFSIDENFFSLLQKKKIAFSISKAGFVPQHTILEQAQVPQNPFYPDIAVVVLSGFSSAVALSLLFIIIGFLFRNKISSTIELESYLGSKIPVIGTIPFQKSGSSFISITNKTNSKTILAEAFRTIRTNLQFFSQTEGSKLMCITSTISGEGKTFIALNLSSIIAMTGKRVVLVDMDLRRPKVHERFNVKNGKGTSHILIGKAKLEDCICHSSIENLDYITAGAIPPNPSELLLSQELQQMIAALKKQYDLVIIDTPPIGLVTDGVSLLKSADYPIYVFLADYSKRQFVYGLKKLYNSYKIKNLSAVLNGIDVKFRSYSNYGYGYNYYDDYHDSESKKIFSLRKLFKGKA